MKKKMETTIVYWNLYGDNGKENGNHYSFILKGTSRIFGIYGF